MLHEMRLDKAPFDLIASGQKTYELRLYDEKRRAISSGDQIRFTASSGDALTVTVRETYRYRSFKELYNSLPLLRCGYTDADIATAKPEDMERYYTIAQQRQYGVVALEIELCEGSYEAL